MCEYCYTSPHLRGCPAGNDDDEKYTNKCSYCGEFFVDDEGIVTSDDAFCNDCMEKFDIDDVLQIFGCDSVRELMKTLA